VFSTPGFSKSIPGVFRFISVFSKIIMCYSIKTKISYMGLAMFMVDNVTITLTYDSSYDYLTIFFIMFLWLTS